MNNKITYGHRNFGGSFKPIFTVGTEGFEHNGKNYKWADIEKIKRYDYFLWSLIFYQAGTPLAYLFLKDGTKIKIKGRILEIAEGNSTVSFVSGTTNAYDQLLVFLEKNVGR